MKAAVVIPVYNDLESLNILIEELKSVLSQKDISPDIYVIDDGSTKEFHKEHFALNLTILSLKRNSGHQSAIALGLHYCKEHFKGDAIVVMDADGEDDPKYIPKMLDIATSKEELVFAKRSKRSEGLIFKFFYRVYKILFYLLTGKSISFGNYSVIPASRLEKIVEIDGLWDHYSGAVIKSKLQYSSIASKRSKRYKGKSKMNFTSLVLHAFASISVYIETVLTRIVLFTSAVFLVNCVLASIVLYRKFVSDLASPGWATTVIFGLILVSLTLMGFSFLIGLIVLNSKNKGAQNDPGKKYSSLIREINRTN